MRWLDASPRRAAPKGHETFILRAASTSSHRLLQRRLPSAHTAQNAVDVGGYAHRVLRGDRGHVSTPVLVPHVHDDEPVRVTRLVLVHYEPGNRFDDRTAMFPFHLCPLPVYRPAEPVGRCIVA